MFPVPHEDDTLIWRRHGHEDVIEHLGCRTSYTYQLEAFAAAVREGGPVVTDVDFSVANMTMVDDAYLLAGMEPRRPGVVRAPPHRDPNRHGACPSRTHAAAVHDPLHQGFFPQLLGDCPERNGSRALVARVRGQGVSLMSGTSGAATPPCCTACGSTTLPGSAPASS